MSQVAPKTPRDVFELLQQYNDSKGLEELLVPIDWSVVSPQQVYGVVLQRIPEARQFVEVKSDYSAYAHFRRALLCNEFQSSIVRLLANAYPEKRRLIHIHIPKTAGVDLKHKLIDRYPHIGMTISQGDRTTRQAFFNALRDTTLRLQASDLLYFWGHRSVNWYLQESLYRYGDRLFSVVRHPQDIIISFINFILGRFQNDPQMTSPDVRDWATAIGLESLPQTLTSSEVRSISCKLLENSEIIIPNILSSYLGKGTADFGFGLNCANEY